MVMHPGASRRSPWLDVRVVEAVGPGVRGIADAFAGAVRTSIAPLVLIARADAAPALDDPALTERIEELFRSEPGLACVALDATEPPPRGPLPLANVGVSSRRPELLPLGLVARLEVLRHLGGLLDLRRDPWLEVIERIGAVAGAVRWSALPGPAIRPAPSGPGPAEPFGAPLTNGRRVERDPGRDDPELGWLLGDRWVEVVRVRGSDGGARLAGVDQCTLSAGEEVERSIAFVHRAEFPSGAPLLVRGERPQRYPAEPSGETRCLGWLHPYGLPGGVALMVFHDPVRNDDLVGHAGEEHAGRHPARLLGWAMEVPDPLPRRQPDVESDQLAVTLRGGRHAAVPVDSAEIGPGGVVAVVFTRPRVGALPLYGGLANGQAVLTLDPSAPGLHDVDWLGYIEHDRAVEVFHRAEPTVSSRPRPTAIAVARRAAGEARRVAVRPRRRRGEPPRTLVVAPWLSVGGGDHFLLSLLGSLRERGFLVWVATTFPRDEWPLDNSPAFAPVVEAIVRLPEDLPGVPVPTAVAKLGHLHGIDQILLCGGVQLYGGLAALKSVCPDLRVIDQLFNDVGHLANNRAHRNAIDLTICAYEALRRKILIEYGEAPDRVDCVYIGIDTQRFRPLPPAGRARAKAELGFDPGRPLWGFLGRVSEEKRLPDLIDALELIRGGHDATVLIQGDGPARDDLLRALDGRNGLAEVRPFASDSLRVFQALDAYILPSRTEGIPLAVMEAMACGAIPVATAVGGVPELVTHGRTGYLALPDDPGSIANALLALARTPPRLRVAMAQEARHVVRDKMSSDKMVDDYVRLLSAARV